MQLPTPEDVIAAIDVFIERHGMSPTRFGADATGDPNLIAALKGGSSPSLKRLHRIAGFMAAKDREVFGVDKTISAPASACVGCQRAPEDPAVLDCRHINCPIKEDADEMASHATAARLTKAA